MKKYFLLLVFFTIINVLVSVIFRIKIEIDITDQNSSIVKAQESPFLLLEEEKFKLSVPKQEELELEPNCIVLSNYTNEFVITSAINTYYTSGYRLKGFGVSSKNDSYSVFGSMISSTSSEDKYVAVLCKDN